MSIHWILATAGGPASVTVALGAVNRTTQDIFLVVLAVAAVTLVFGLWAIFFRKTREHKSPWQVHQHQFHSAYRDGERAERRRRRRRRRREHRPRNPTLAETGGLPPVRPQPPPEPESLAT